MSKSPLADKSLAYLGLGIMGGAMALNLASNKNKLCVYNRSARPELEAKLQSSGIRVHRSATDAIKDADIIFLCLSDEKDITELVLGRDGIAKQAKPEALFVDMSTSGPICARKLGKELQAMGLRFIDAPVTGGQQGAENATLTIMVGGAKADFEECKPYLQCLGTNVIHCGDVGSGQAVKLCNQILCAVNMLAVCEALTLAKHLEINPQLILDVCTKGAAGSWALANLGPKIVAQDFNPGFMIKDILKDLRLASESMNGNGNLNEILPGTDIAQRRFCDAAQATSERNGTQAMIKAYS